MTSQEFIDALKIAVVNGSVKAVNNVLHEPPGRSPMQKFIDMSKWFNSLNSEDKGMIISIVEYSVEAATFGFLCVLDGVRAIEDSPEKGQFQLYYEKNGEKVLLNNPEDDYLHDLL